jgi:hypothetical protein
VVVDRVEVVLGCRERQRDHVHEPEAHRDQQDHDDRVARDSGHPPEPFAHADPRSTTGQDRDHRQGGHDRDDDPRHGESADQRERKQYDDELRRPDDVGADDEPGRRPDPERCGQPHSGHRDRAPDAEENEPGRGHRSTVATRAAAPARPQRSAEDPGTMTVCRSEELAELVTLLLAGTRTRSRPVAHSAVERALPGGTPVAGSDRAEPRHLGGSP